MQGLSWLMPWLWARFLESKVDILRCPLEEEEDAAAVGAVDFEGRCYLCQDLMEQVPQELAL
jgi:hypothetical protein